MTDDSKKENQRVSFILLDQLVTDQVSEVSVCSHAMYSSLLHRNHLVLPSGTAPLPKNRMSR